MARARLSLNPEQDYQLVHFKPASSEWTLHDHRSGLDILVFESDLAPSEAVEVRCDFCGRWSSESVPTARDPNASWRCFTTTGGCLEDREPSELAAIR
jgi:hypothetical protein